MIFPTIILRGTRSAVPLVACVALLGCDDKEVPQQLPPPDLPERTTTGEAVPDLDRGAPPNAAPTTAAADDESFDKFVTTQTQLGALQQVMQKRAAEGEEPTQLQQEFDQQAAAVVQRNGLSPETFSQYFERIQSDPAFRTRVEEAVQAKAGTAMKEARIANEKDNDSEPSELD